MLYFIPSLPSPFGGPYQVAIEDWKSESEEKFEVKLTKFLGLKQEEGVTMNIKSEPTKMSVWENAFPKVRAIISLHHLDFGCSK